MRPLDVPVTETLAVGSPAGGSADQFGTDYYDVSLDNGDYELNFSGQPKVDVLPTTAPDAGPMIWGNAGDSVDTTLTRTVDLTGANDPVLTFKTWYDIEHWYDWGYVSASTDGGEDVAGAAAATTPPPTTREGRLRPGLYRRERRRRRSRHGSTSASASRSTPGRRSCSGSST